MQKQSEPSFSPLNYARGMTLGLVLALAICALQSDGATTAWTNAADGNWDVAGNWDAGVPDGNNADLTISDVSYTVTYGVSTNAFDNLTIGNSASYTTTLDVEAAGFAPSRTNLLQSGALVNVKTGGVWEVDLVGPGRFEIHAGAQLNINGGSLIYTNLTNTFPFIISGASGSTTSLLTMTSGRFEIGAVALSPQAKFYVGWSGDGIMNMSGGTTILDNCYGISVGYGAAHGIINLSGGKMIVRAPPNEGPYVTIGSANANALGEITVSGDAQLVFEEVKETFIGYRGGIGRFRVDGGTASLTGGTAKTYIGHRGSGFYNTTGTVTVTAGRFEAHYVFIGSSIIGGDAGGDVGELFVYGGEVFFRSYCYCGYAKNDLTNGIGRITVTNGVLNAKSLYVGVNGDAAPSFAQANGELTLSGSGVITNLGLLYVGQGVNSTGIVTQTSGLFDQDVNSVYTVIGANGGHGEYRMSGGQFKTKWIVFVGGARTDILDLGSIPAEGLLSISGGTFSVSHDMHIGELGDGTLEISGSDGTLLVDGLVATNGTSTIRFKLDSSGAGTVTVDGDLYIGGNAKLEIDVSDYDVANGREVDLIAYVTRYGKFAAENVTVNGGHIGSTILYGDGSADKIKLKLFAGTIVRVH